MNADSILVIPRAYITNEHKNTGDLAKPTLFPNPTRHFLSKLGIIDTHAHF